MAVSSRNERLELEAIQMWEAPGGGGAVFARLLVDRDMRAAYDLRYFSKDKRRPGKWRAATNGVICNTTQLMALRDALSHLTTVAEGKGLK